MLEERTSKDGSFGACLVRRDTACLIETARTSNRLRLMASPNRYAASKSAVQAIPRSGKSLVVSCGSSPSGGSEG